MLTSLSQSSLRATIINEDHIDRFDNQVDFSVEWVSYVNVPYGEKLLPIERHYLEYCNRLTPIVIIGVMFCLSILIFRRTGSKLANMKI